MPFISYTTFQAILSFHSSSRSYIQFIDWFISAISFLLKQLQRQKNIFDHVVVLLLVLQKEADCTSEKYFIKHTVLGSLIAHAMEHNSADSMLLFGKILVQQTTTR